MAHETIEEAAAQFYPPTTTDLICSPKLVRDAFIEGAKWQAERRYSEEEVIELLHRRMFYTLGQNYNPTTTIKWFEQFKNQTP
jgi:hypothetical protein